MACKVKQGVKWVTQRWIRFEDYQNVEYPVDPTVDEPRQKSGRKWDIREINQFPRMYYVEDLFEPVSLKEMFAHRKISKELQERLDLTALSFDNSSVEFLDVQGWRPLTDVPEGSHAVVLVFLSEGDVVFMIEPPAEKLCEQKTDCCAAPVGTKRIHMQSMDALLFYPRKTDGKAEPWGKRFALCAEHPNRSLGEVIQVSYGEKEVLNL